MSRPTLTTNERIKSSTEITTLIHHGRAFFLAPYKVYYSWGEKAQSQVRVAFAVPKKKFGKAVMRNKLKRLGRESFRLQRQELLPFCAEKEQQLNVLFIYQKTAALPYAKLYKAIGEAINHIVKNG